MLRKRMVFRKRKISRSPPPVQHIVVITMIVFALMVFLSIMIIDKGIKPTLMDIAQTKTTEFATRGINTAVRFAENYNYDDLLNITYDNEGKVATYNWNSSVVSEINRVATDRVEEYFRYMNSGEPPDYENSLFEPEEFEDTTENLPEKDPTVVEIPLGQATGNTILANLGPKIPVNFEIVGNVRTNIVRDDEPLGLNGSWVSLYVEVEADVQIVVPFSTETKTVATEIYIDGGALMGDVPDFYGGGGSDGPSISVPKDSITNENQE
ncbi:sporulation protein YunB [Lentibacillus kapialis]|uniref:Sporulation protein YunB n=1 Tax=Lentibacillus kapialis TaxID=340214 RepID=A0A917UWI4_9BACI|nr:sporulation protein YunB [Lentibacillus kapialis]GGJ89937.1 sporulation protein YunB [Lentibacillus kapialis]